MVNSAFVGVHLPEKERDDLYELARKQERTAAAVMRLLIRQAIQEDLESRERQEAVA